MKILLANNHFANYGGADVLTYESGKLFRKKGHEVFFFASDREPFFENDYIYKDYFPQYYQYKKLSKPEILKNIFRPLYNPEAENKLEALIKKIKPDIAHFSCINYHLTPSVINACYKNNVPVVITLHDARSLCPAGTLMKNDEQYCFEEHCVGKNPFPCIVNKCKYKSLVASTLVSAECVLNNFYNIKNKASVIISPSQALLELAARAGYPRQKLRHVNNFINDSFFNHQPEYTNKNYFLFAGRLVKEKGVDILLNAMAFLPDIELHIVGTGKEEANLKFLAKQLNLKNVKFLGFKTGIDLVEEYKGCIASIIPSNYFEIFGLTIVESFAYGKPVIGSNLAAIPEIIEDNINGLIFEAGNYAALANKIKILYSNDILAKKMGVAGRNKAETLYNSDKYYYQIIKTYEEVSK